MKELKSFLLRIKCKMSTTHLFELFNFVDIFKTGELNYDQFDTLYRKLLLQYAVRMCSIYISI